MVGSKLPKEQRRREMLDAAAQIARQEGLEKVTAARLAKVANVSPGLVFHYFQNKEGILSALLIDRVQRRFEEVEQHQAETQQGKLETLIVQEVEHFGAHAADVEIFLAFSFLQRNERYLSIIHDAVKDYYEAFASAAEEASDNPDEINDLIHVIITLIQGVAVTAIIAPDRFNPELIARTIRSIASRIIKEKTFQ